MKFRLSSEYGELSEVRDGVHHGVDLAMETGTQLRSIGDGVVVKVGEMGDLGKGVIIKLDNGYTAIYGHLSETKVKIGQKLSELDPIGLSGNTGNSTGGHLHFALLNPSGEYINPTPLVPRLDEISGVMEPTSVWGSMLQGYNDFADWFIGKEVEFIFKPISEGIKDSFIFIGQELTNVMPELTVLIMLGFVTIGMFYKTGKFMLLGAGVYLGGAVWLSLASAV